ncbi:hypothetical protein SAMN05421505_11889 [Sinosporangium album]|uniref:Uncharacterized protein n=1 Tax=Sinosporangium album TaxID=504805 RepID=A0A1G8DKR5_9ACTN|nr:hypothetical protein SAMN05421505_11889 [Sinosporangium album]
MPGPHSILGLGYGLNSTPPLDQVAFANTRVVRANGPASAGGVGSARGLAGIAVTATTSRPPGTALHDALTSGYTAGMLGAGGFYLAAILTAVLLLRPRPANRDSKPTPETLGSTPG